MFRFTIRDVLWLMVVVGLIIGWATTGRRMSALEAKFATLRADYQALEKDDLCAREILSGTTEKRQANSN